MFALSFVWALVTALALGGIKFLRQREAKPAVKTAAWSFGTALAINLFMMYFIQPALTGTFAGMTPFMTVAVITGLIIGAVHAVREDSYDSERKPKVGMRMLIASGGLLVLMLGWFSLYYLGVTWGSGNARQNASFAQVRAASSEEKLPKTDPSHMVMVTRSIAAYLGQQALASTGDNLGSIFMTSEEHFVLQSIQGHLYWVAPLEYSSAWNQLGIGVNNAVDATPGYVAVDAEDPNARVQVHKDQPIRYMPAAWFSKDLERHVYLSGYMYGTLDDPTFEVDDNWKPFFTISYTVPARTVRADVIKKVLLVDANSGDIQEFDQDKLPAWIDRVMSKSLVEEYLEQWGKWSDQRSLSQWPNFGNQYQMVPEHTELLYNSVDKPVWLVPMTSRNTTDMSCTGVVLYDTNKNESVFYPGLAGIGIGANVTDAFVHSPKNLKGYQVDQLQLYSIDGEPTWVAVYVQSAGEHGKTFAAIGMVDAKHVQGANVVMAADKRTALAAYASYLAGVGGANSGNVSTAGQPGKMISGRVHRIGWALVDGQAVYTLQVEGDTHTFTATLKVQPKLPLVREGDAVKITYLETSEEVLPVMDLTDDNLVPASIPDAAPKPAVEKRK